MPLNSVKLYSKQEYYEDVYEELEETPEANLTETVEPPAPAEPEQDGNFSRGLSAGIDQTQALGGGIKALAGSIFGKEDWVEDGMAYYQEQMAEAEENAGDVMTIEEIDSVGDFGAWSAYTLGTVVPDLVGAVATMGLGSTVVKAGAKSAIKKAVEEYAQNGRDELVKQGMEKEAADKIAGEVAERYAEAKASQLALRGGTGGAVAYGTAQGSGNQFAQTLQDTGEEAPYISLTSGLAQGSLNAIPAFKVLSDMIPANLRDDAVQVIQEGVNQPWVGQFLRDVAAVQGIEGLTEGLQYIIEQETIAYVNNNFTENEAIEYFDYISNERKRSGLINQTAAGILTGTATGTGGATTKKLRGGYDADLPDFNAMRDVSPEKTPRERRLFIADTFNKYRDRTVLDPEANPRPIDPVTKELAMAWDKNGALDPETNRPYTPEQIKEANIAILTDYRVEPQEAVTEQVEEVVEESGREVPQGNREYGNDHRWDVELAEPAKPVQDQLLELSSLGNTKEALDPSNTDVVVEPIDQDDVDRVFDRNETLKIGTAARPKGKSLPTIEENYGDQADSVTNAVAGVMADLSKQGVPVKFIDSVSGVFVHSPDDVDAPALTGKGSRGISINTDLISGAMAEQDQLRELAWTMTHEVYHAADYAYDLSTGDDRFTIKIVDDSDAPRVEMGAVMEEIFDNWEKGTPVGKRFDYPFNDLGEDIKDLEQSNDSLNDTYREEVFAQLGALFHSNPKELQQYAPEAYNYIKGIRDNNLQTAQVEVQDEQSSSPVAPETTQPSGISGEVRAPPEPRSEQIVQPEPTGSDGEAGTGEGRADIPVARSEQDESGQRERSEVQESALDQPAPERITYEKIKRGAEFEFDRTYDVSYPDGAVYQMYRDSVSNPSEPSWNLDPSNYDLLGLSPQDPARVMGIGFNRKEALVWLDDAVNRQREKKQETEQPLTEEQLIEQELGQIDDNTEAFELTDDDLSDLDEMGFIKKEDLSEAGQKITASGALYGDETIEVQGTGRGGSTVVVDLARAFDARVKEATGGKTLGEQTDENAEAISDLIAHEAVQAMKTDGNAGEWYQQKVANAMSLAADVFPELNTDPNAKFAFTAIMSITSNGASVPENSVNTFEIYESYRDSKVFPDFGVGKEAQAMKSSFALLNRLVDLKGIDAVREFMDKDVTVKQLKDAFDLSVSGELMGTKLKGSAILGPKIGGGFFQNLNGNFDPLTMDRWFMRTWGRLSGTLMADAERKLPVQLAKFRETALSDEYRSKLKQDGIKRNQLAKDDAYATEYAMQVQAAYANGGFKVKNAINKASNTFKNSQQEKQAPQNGKEREYIRSVMRIALDKVNQTSGQDPVNMGALQAIVWYPEKDLYKLLGVGNAKSEPTDYETEFRKIVESREERGQDVSGPVGPEQQSGSGQLQPSAEQDVADTDQPSGEEDQQPTVESSQEETTPARPEQNRINQRMKDAVQDRIDRKISAEDLNQVFEEEGRFVAPMTPDMVPEIPSEEKFVNALKKTSTEKPNTPSKETYWMADVLEDGQRYGSRLDIPSYNAKQLSKEERVDTVTMHASRPRKEGQPFRGAAGTRLGYYPTVRLKNALFASPDVGATKIAMGATKNTIATIEGEYVAADHEQNRADFLALMNDPAWTQVSMNPERHTYFYDLEKQAPVVSASEVIQVGNLVIAKDVETDDVENYAFIKKKQMNKELNKLDDGTPSTNKFSYNDEIDSQSDLARRLRDRKVYKSLVDRYADLQDFEEQAADYLGMGRLPAAISPRDQENLSHGKVQVDLDAFHKDHVDPIGDLIAELGYTVEAVDIYLIAKHAAERNDAIAEKVKDQRARNIQRVEREIEQLKDDVGVDHTVAIANREAKLKEYDELPLAFQDTGSGMTYAEAEKVLDLAKQEGTESDLERIAEKVYDMLGEYRERMVTSGLLDEETRADWEERFEFYVPLKGFAAQDDGETYVRDAKSRGFSVVGKESMKAKGRKTLPFSPLLTSFEDVQKKIIRARKNEYANTLLDLLSELGNSDSYTIYNTKFRPMKESDELTQQELRQMSLDVRPNGDPRYVEVKRDGQTFFIEFASDKLNHALQNMSVPMLSRANESISKVLTLATRFQTFRRNMLINYNPTWGAVNPMRDVATGVMYALGEMDKKGSRVKGQNLAGKAAQSYLPAVRSLWRYYRGKPARDGNEMDAYAKEYVEVGAPTGMVLMKDADEQLRILRNKLKRGYTREALKTMAKVVEDYNITMENAIRFALYVEARKIGVAPDDAATFTKDSTVNFNRKGEDTAVVNAGYLFFNAAVQGNMNFLQALQDDGGKGDKRTTTARKAALGLVALGSAITLFNILSSEEDDDEELIYADIPEHGKNRALLFMYGQEEGFALPAPYGYNFFTNIGRLSTEVGMGTKDFKEAGYQLWENFLLNFVPVAPSAGENWEDSARGFYPDLLELHLDMMANKNFFGSDIYIEQNPLFVERSAAYNERRSTDKMFSVPAQFLNDLTGGDKYRDGYIAMNPDKMQYVYEYFLGGVGRFISQTTDVVSRGLADEEFRKQDLPLVGTFFESPSDYEDRFEFYANWEETRKIVTRFKEAQSREEVQSLQDEYKSYLPLLNPTYGGKNLYELSNRDLRRISKRRKLIEKQDFGGAQLGEAKKRELLDQLEADENMIFDIFNKAYRKAERGE